MANIARLGVVLGLDSAEFQSGLKAADKGMSDFADKAKGALAAGAAIGVAAIGAMTAKALAYADTMADVAKANDVGIASVLQLSAALTSNGGEADNAGKLLASLTMKIDGAAQGGQGAQDSFKKVGVSLKDLASLSSEDIMKKTLDGLSKIEDPVSRNALAMDIFGKAAKGVDFAVGGLGDSMATLDPVMVKHAQAVQIAGDFNDILAKSTNDATLSFMSGLFPALKDITGAMADTSAAEVGFVSNTAIMDTAIRGLAVAAFETVHWIKSMGDGLGAMAAMAFAVARGDLKEAELINKQWEENTKAAVAQHEATIAKVWSGKGGTAEAPKVELPSITGPLRTVKAFVDPAIAAKQKKDEADALKAATEASKRAEELRIAKEITGIYETQAANKLDALKSAGDMLLMTTDEKQLRVAMLAIDDQRAAKLDEIQKKLDKENAKDKKIDKTYSADVIAELERQKVLVGEVSDKYKQMTADEITSQQAIQKTFTFGWTKAFNQYAEDSRNYGKMGEQAFNSVVGQMSSAIDRFVKTQKINFKDFAAGIIQELTAIQLKMSAMELFKQASSGIGSLLGNIMGNSPVGGGASVIDNTMGSGSAFPWPAHANGGTVSGGSPSIVGERGPELFIPGRSGAIIPTNDMSALTGGSSGPTFNGPYIAQMSAIDTQSAAQFLSNNKMMIFSANQSAARSIPQGR